jgi:hypothetical protein
MPPVILARRRAGVELFSEPGPIFFRLRSTGSTLFTGLVARRRKAVAAAGGRVWRRAAA